MSRSCITVTLAYACVVGIPAMFGCLHRASTAKSLVAVSARLLAHAQCWPGCVVRKLQQRRRTLLTWRAQPMRFCPSMNSAASYSENNLLPKRCTREPMRCTAPAPNSYAQAPHSGSMCTDPGTRNILHLVCDKNKRDHAQLYCRIHPRIAGR